MRKVTNRQFQTWQTWFEMELNRPNRNDYYLMQISSDIKNLFAKQYISPNDRKLKLHWVTEVDQGLPVEEEEPNMIYHVNGKTIAPPKPLTPENISAVQAKIAESVWTSRAKRV